MRKERHVHVCTKKNYLVAKYNYINYSSHEENLEFTLKVTLQYALNTEAECPNRRNHGLLADPTRAEERSRVRIS